jgi:CNT family concentrative nucleoside transporter
VNPQGLIGVGAILLLAWAVSEDRRALFSRKSARFFGAALLVHVVLAALLLAVPAVRESLSGLNVVVQALDRATQAGTSFVFGYLGGGKPPFKPDDPNTIAVLAFRFLPLMLVISAIASLLFHWRILPAIVRGFSWLLERALGLRGALTVGAAANVFVGMVESPILIRPYVARMSRGELFALMTVGMATIAGTVLVLYATILSKLFDGALGHLLGASILNVPASLMIAGLMVPFLGETTEGGLDADVETKGAMDAIAQGTAQGLTLLLNVVAMLLVLVALVALVDILLGVFPDVGGKPLGLERILGWALSPLAFAIGIPWSEAGDAGALLGTKVVINELKAYLDMTGAAGTALSERSKLILVYAMCGFANMASLGIMVGGIGAIAPERRAEIAGLGFKSVAAGLMSTCFTASVVGLFL